MTPRNSLRRSIAFVYLLFVVCSTLFFSIIAAVAVEGIENHLVDNRLKQVARWASPRVAGGLPVSLPAGLSFHHGHDIPLSLQGLAPGVHDIAVDGVGLQVLVGKDKAGDYVVVDHESDYEKVELVVYSLFALAFAGSLMLSVLLEGYIGRRLVTPILSLAAAVRSDSPVLPLLERGDELGVLARAFAAHTAELRGYLDRERYFTGDVSHELRTPLTVITGAAEILLANSGADPRVVAPAERILRSANEATECINVLLMLARSPARMPQASTDIAAIAQRETAHYQALVAAKPVELVFEGGPPFSVAAPPELCGAMIGNLVRNACQYTSEGRVVVRLRGRSVIVEDTGPGMPPAALAAFLGGGQGRDGASSGAGIGLGLVRRISESLGATARVAAREGGGTVFSIDFPAEHALTKS